MNFLAIFYSISLKLLGVLLSVIINQIQNQAVVRQDGPLTWKAFEPDCSACGDGGTGHCKVRIIWARATTELSTGVQ